MREILVSTTSFSSKSYEDVLKENETKKANEASKTKEDVWVVTTFDDADYVRWSDKTTKEKIQTVAVSTLKIVIVVGCLYLFICSISMLGDAFQILAGKAAGDLFSNTSFLQNPITGLIIGMLVTALIQSSSTSISIVVTMVAADILDVADTVYIVMGANIGTSVTNTIVSLTQSLDKQEFRRAFAGATVHDVFNLMSVLVFLPLEYVSGYLQALTKAIVDSFHIQGGADAPDMLKAITNPFVKSFVEINKTVITLVAQEVPLEANSSMIKTWCESTSGYINVTELTNQTVVIGGVNVTVETNVTVQQKVSVGLRLCKSPEDFLFANTGLSDVEAGVILLIVSLIILISCLMFMVKVLNSMMHGSVSRMVKKLINTNFKYPFGWVTGYLALLFGAGMTFVIQSSSVFTSILTPLVGIGVVQLKRMYPLTLGANLGTTTTSILAALASDPSRLQYSLQVSLIHLFFNLSGILAWYPVPFMRLPIKGAKFLGNTTAEYRWFAVLYVVCAFFVFPAILLALSFASVWALIAVIIVIALVAIFVIAVNVLQKRKPLWLPACMRTWEFLPLPLRSLRPYDRFMTKYLLCKCCSKKPPEDDVVSLTKRRSSVMTDDVETASRDSANELASAVEDGLDNPVFKLEDGEEVDSL